MVPPWFSSNSPSFHCHCHTYIHSITFHISFHTIPIYIYTLICKIYNVYIYIYNIYIMHIIVYNSVYIYIIHTFISSDCGLSENASSIPRPSLASGLPDINDVCFTTLNESSTWSPVLPKMLRTLLKESLPRPNSEGKASNRSHRPQIHRPKLQTSRNQLESPKPICIHMYPTRL